MCAVPKSTRQALLTLYGKSQAQVNFPYAYAPHAATLSQTLPSKYPLADMTFRPLQRECNVQWQAVYCPRQLSRQMEVVNIGYVRLGTVGNNHQECSET
jgi:hypothetical protein